MAKFCIQAPRVRRIGATHEPSVTCPVSGCNEKIKQLKALKKHVRSKTLHSGKLSAAKIAEFCLVVDTLFKESRAAIKQAFLEAKAAAQNQN